MKFNIFILVVLFSGFSTLAFPQKEVRKNIRSGNKEYKQEKYTDAEIDYRKALENNTQSVEAAYNLGNALYKQNKFPEASEQYQVVVGKETDKEKLAMAWHNMGNIFMNAQDYAKSIEAYKRSLRNNPKDDETRYNLALAQKLLEDQQQDQQNQDQNKDQQNQDQNKDQENQDQNKDQEQKQNQNQQQDDKKEDKTQEQPQPEEKISKDNAQQILDAMLQDEKNTQEKVKEAQQRQMQRKKVEKDW
jgi:tetratricopeptide (TPR) repeat protein